MVVVASGMSQRQSSRYFFYASPFGGIRICIVSSAIEFQPIESNFKGEGKIYPVS